TPMVTLKKAQLKQKLDALTNKTLYGISHRAIKEGSFDMDYSPTWRNSGNIKAHD
ncbi:MAG: hypothetical protein MHPSP_001547, partial [Paramarteilia canceri]